MPATDASPPPGGRAMYCACGANWAAVYGPRPFLDHAACIVARFGFDRIRCVRCGGTIATVPASAEART